MASIYDVAAGPGRAAGQGLMALGSTYSDIQERKERKKKKKFSNVLSMINIFTKMGEGLSPENRQRLFTAKLLPMMAQAGGFAEGMDVKGITDFIGSLAASEKDTIKFLKADSDKLLGLIDQGKKKEARRYFNQMKNDYGVTPGAKSVLDNLGGLLDTELKERKETEKGIMEGGLVQTKPGEQGFQQGGLMVRGKTPGEITQEKANQTRATTRAKLEVEKEFGVGQAGRDGRTTTQKEFDRFVQNNPDFKGNLLDFKNALKAKDPVEVALALAQKDDRVLVEPEKLNEVAMEYLEHIKTLRSGKPEQEQSGEPPKPEGWVEVPM